MTKATKPPDDPQQLENLFRKLADQLDKAGDRCRVKKGGNACITFDVTADVLRHAPRFFGPTDLDGAADATEPGRAAAALTTAPPPTPVSPPVTPPAPVTDAVPPAAPAPTDPIKAVFADVATAGEGGSDVQR